MLLNSVDEEENTFMYNNDSEAPKESGIFSYILSLNGIMRSDLRLTNVTFFPGVKASRSALVKQL